MSSPPLDSTLKRSAVPAEGDSSLAPQMSRASTADVDPERARVRAQVRQRLFGEPPEPQLIGRFEVIERIGSGAMGVVYQARDPQLDRLVALKLLHPSLSDDAVGPRTKLLLREARAMAKLSHPNVVVVHEVGTHENQVFIAMEMVRGGTLREWLEWEKPSAERLLQVLIEAGRGLAAAHRQGLVHRDFKLDNTLMGDDGRPRVADFGLVKPGTASNDEAPPSVPLSHRGAIVGTPAYMAPEQLRGEPADERSDQFAFCISVVEALTGQRPFSANSLPGLLRAAQAGLPESSVATLPAGLARAMARGLKPDPAERYPSMDALLEEMQRVAVNPRRSRRPTVAIGAALLIAGLVALGAIYRSQIDSERPAAALASVVPGAKDLARHAPVDVTRLCVTATKSSSETKGHPAAHAFDGSVRTAWTEGSAGDGTGEWIEATLAPGTWLDHVQVGAGWSAFTDNQDVDLWLHNNSIRRMRVSWDSGEAIIMFDRTTDRAERKVARIGAETTKVRITALEVDRGRFNDLCLDEIVLSGYCAKAAH